MGGVQLSRDGRSQSSEAIYLSYDSRRWSWHESFDNGQRHGVSFYIIRCMTYTAHTDQYSEYGIFPV